MTMSAILTDVGLIVTNTVTWMGSIVNFITENPIVLMGVIIGFVGLGVGLLSRIFGLRA